MLDMQRPKNLEDPFGSEDMTETSRPFANDHDDDIWETFVRENWAPTLESVHGPDWRTKYREDVTAIVASCQNQRTEDSEDNDFCSSDYPMAVVATEENDLTFGSFQPNSVNDRSDVKISSERSRGTHSREQRHVSQRAGSFVASEIDAIQEMDCRRNGSRTRIQNDILEKIDFDAIPGVDWEDLSASGQDIFRAFVQENMTSKAALSMGSRQERRKAKRSGGTKRMGEDVGIGHIPDKHVTQVEHRIEITGGSATFTHSSRSVPSKSVCGITNQPLRNPMEPRGVPIGSSSGRINGYSFSGPTTEHQTTFKAFTSSQSRMTSIDGSPVDDWMFEEAGMAVGMDLDDPHHPHKKVHKQFAMDGSGKMSKTMKKQGRITRRQSTMFSSRVPATPLHGLTSPLDALPNRDVYDDTFDSPPKPMEASTDFKSKREENRRRQGKHSNTSGGQELRCTIELTASRRPSVGDSFKMSLSGRPSISSRQMSSSLGESLSKSQTASKIVIPRDAQVEQLKQLSLEMQFQKRLQQIIERTDNHGRCPLHIAVMAGRADIVEQLIQHGCDVERSLSVDLLKRENSQATTEATLWGPPSVTPGLSSRDYAKRVAGEKSQRRDAEPEYGYDRRKESKVDGNIWWNESYTHTVIDQPSLMNRISFKSCNALHLAAYYGHVAVLELLLSRSDIDVNANNEHGLTPLHVAAHQGHSRIVTSLLNSQSCDIDAADFHGLTALHHAAARGHATIIDILWPKGCKIDAADVMGWTALHYAAHAGHVDAVGNLIIAGCPVSKYDSFGLTPGHLAAYKGYGIVLEKLLHAGFYHDMQGGMAVLHNCGGSTALHMAAMKGHAPVIKQLLAEGANIQKEDFRGLTPLQCSAEGGHLEAFNILLEAGCNPNVVDPLGTTMLHSAANGKNWEIVKQLLQFGCDPTARTQFGRTSLHHAAQVGAKTVVENLLKRDDCDIFVADIEANMPWHAAADGGNLTVLELFLKKGCDIEAKNKSGCTVLHLAANAGSDAIVKALAGRGANLQEMTAAGETALHIAARKGHESVLTFLIEKVDVNTINLKDRKGTTVLHHVCEGKSLEAFKMLIERRANLNATNHLGQTPLHLATMHHSETLVTSLLDQGCDITIKDGEGCTALHYAAQKNDAVIFDMLFTSKACNVADKDRRGFGLLHYAVEGGNPDIVSRVICKGAAQFDQLNGSENTMNALHVACELGHVSVASYLIVNAGYSVRARGPDRREPIHFASGATKKDRLPWRPNQFEDHERIVEMLIERGADVHVVDGLGCNALMYAAGVADLKLVSRFLEMGVDPLRRDHSHRTSMHWAARSGYSDIIELLHDSGVPVAASDKKGRLPLHIAAKMGELYAVAVLVDKMTKSGLDIHKRDAEGRSPVQLAAAAGYANVVTKLLEGAKEKEVKDMTGLHLGIQMKMQDIVKSLLNSGNCDVNARDADGCTPLHYAAESGSRDLVEMLLVAKADMFITGSDGMMPIHRAATEGHLDVIDLLIEHGALRNYYTTSGSTPLHYAASHNHRDVITRLVRKGVPVNHMSNGAVACTALYCAASSGALEAVNLLLDYGAIVDSVCANECTALHIAATHGHAAVVERLIRHGADVYYQAANSMAAIHNAVNNEHLSTLEKLIAADCDVDVQNSAGNTPLHIAACKGYLEIARVLLDANCDIHIKNSKGYQAIHSAASNGYFDVVLLLVQRGAPWRQKGDLDVARLLCRKSNLMASYVDGRLKIAERSKHRKTKQAEASESIPSEEELKQAQAQADAVMAELLAEEEKERKNGDQKQRNRKNKDKRKKQHSVDSKKHVAVDSNDMSHPTEQVEEKEMSVEQETRESKTDKSSEMLDTFPRVLLKGRNRTRIENPFPILESKAKSQTNEKRAKKKESQQKQRKNRQPAPPLPETSEKSKSPMVTELVPSKKVSVEGSVERKASEIALPQSIPKSQNTLVTVLRRRTTSQASITMSKMKSVEVKKQEMETAREAAPKEISEKTKPKKMTVTLTRSISVPEAHPVEKPVIRHSPHRSLTMAAVVAGQGSTTKKPTLPLAGTDSASKESGISPIPKKPMGHEWADAVKSTLEKKKPEPKLEILRSAVANKKPITKGNKQDLKVQVVNVSSNKRTFLPFTETSTVERSGSAWGHKTPSVTSTAVSEVTELDSEPTNDASTVEKFRQDASTGERSRLHGDERKDPVLKWVTKDLQMVSGQNAELRGTRVGPLTQKMKKMSFESGKDSNKDIPETGNESKQTLHLKPASQNPWNVATSQRPNIQNEEIPISVSGVEKRMDSMEKPWSDTSFPPLIPTQNATPSMDTSMSLETLPPLEFPFPGRPAEWNMKSYESCNHISETLSLTSSHGWRLESTDLGLASIASDSLCEALPNLEGNVSFGDPPSSMVQGMEPMDPNLLLPPELKEEITNGGATSNRFRTKHSMDSSKGSPAPISPSNMTSATLISVPQGSPAWTKNAQGPFFTASVHTPMPTSQALPPVSQNAILSKIPDDPWGINGVDLTSVPKLPPMHPPPPDMPVYTEHVPYLCPLSRRPITDPVVAADGITYDRSSFQGNQGYFNPYITYGNAYM